MLSNANKKHKSEQFLQIVQNTFNFKFYYYCVCHVLVHLFVEVIKKITFRCRFSLLQCEYPSTQLRLSGIPFTT